ncbi:MAG: RNA methyltransferase [Melioribacteraceae bacterium]|jgi:TrmH family RNA methyltransferase|nr:RNA methyltransferase [Melioribacteraceae bacterium]
MLTKRELKYYSSLNKVKYRKIEQKFIVEGIKLADEAVSSNFDCEVIIVSDSFAKIHSEKLDHYKHSTIVQIIPDNEFSAIADTQTPQGILAIMEMPLQRYVDETREGTIVALENISDPGNVGTIIRTCDWFGIKDIIISSNSVDIYNPKVIRSTMGSLFHINIHVSENIYATFKALQKNGKSVICTDMNGESIYGFSKNKSSILVFSNEAKGPTEELLEITDATITIPKFGKAESLNVATAAGVIISEFTKPV